METTTQQSTAATVPEKAVVSTSLGEGLAGAGAVALAIIGLAGIYPNLMLAIATIAVGAALLFEGGTIASRLGLIFSEGGTKGYDTAGIGGGMSPEFLGGITGVVLGILALIGVTPIFLTSVAAIVFGGTLILASGINARVNHLVASYQYTGSMARQAAREAATSAASVYLLIGLGAATLGILALIGILPLTLTLVAMLGVGFADLLNGTAAGSRMVSVLHR